MNVLKVSLVFENTMFALIFSKDEKKIKCET